MSNTPIIGLSPMDGITDFAMRHITHIYGHPDVMTTEFVNVEGWHYAPGKIEAELRFTPDQQPTWAQIYGLTPDYFYQATRRIADLGFAGVEINFGCPAKNVVHSGSGAGMIKTPQLAAAIVASVQAASRDSGRRLPVSVKTRLGYDSNIAFNWLRFLLGLNLDRLVIHGRTLTQGYTGQADWSTIAQAVTWRDQLAPTTMIFGNGDIKSHAQALDYCQRYRLDGVLIGRAAIGNPCVFTDQSPSINLRCQAAIDHATFYQSLVEQQDRFSFTPMRKHLAAYVSGFPQAKTLRQSLVQTNNSQEVTAILRHFLKDAGDNSG